MSDNAPPPLYQEPASTNIDMSCPGCGAQTTGPFCGHCGQPAGPPQQPRGQAGFAIGEVDRSGRVLLSARGVALLGVILVVIVGGAVGAWNVLGQATTSYHSITGQLTLTDSGGGYGSMTDGQSCDGANGYSDITEGAEVTISNQSGTILATGALDQGSWSSNSCVFDFSVPHVRDATFYQIEVGHRGNVTFSKAQLQQNSWQALLTLGS